MSSSSPWPATRVTELLGLDHPIVQGPFGGGLSSVELAGVVSDGGGLGSFGAYQLQPDEIGPLVAALRARTQRAFAVNLWVSTHDLGDGEMSRERFDAHVARLQPLYDEVGVAPPPYPERVAPAFAEQAEALLAAAPPVFSFIFGIPEPDLLAAFRERGVVTIGTAITVEEAVALDETGVDAIVVSGFEAGGHRAAFLREAEDSLVGTLPLVAATTAEVRAPVIAAGGIADARGIAAVLALGAEAVQIGTAFLATEESGTTPEHRALLRVAGTAHTRLTRAFSGRLARGVVNRLMEELDADPDAIAPFPYQGYLLAPVLRAARAAGDVDVVSLWAGQANGLVRHRHAQELLDALVAEAPRPAESGPARA